LEKLTNERSILLISTISVSEFLAGVYQREDYKNKLGIAREFLEQFNWIDLNEVVAEETAKKSNKVHVQRFKGLGEMNPEELWETTMDPMHRILKKVNIDDAEEANKIFDILMGSEVPPRKSFIQSNAKLAEIDI